MGAINTFNDPGLGLGDNEGEAKCVDGGKDGDMVFGADGEAKSMAVSSVGTVSLLNDCCIIMSGGEEGLNGSGAPW